MQRTTKKCLVIVLSLLAMASVGWLTLGTDSVVMADHKPNHNPGGGGGGGGNTDPPAADPVIVYAKDGNVMVMNADGSNNTLLISGEISNPNWSANGSRIAFVDNPCCVEIERPDGTFSTSRERLVMVADADGSNQIVVADSTPWWDTWGPSWSPDPEAEGGEKLLFNKYRDPVLREIIDIWIIDPDDESSERNLTLEWEQKAPPPDPSVTSVITSHEDHSWSPEGLRIATMRVTRDALTDDRIHEKLMILYLTLTPEGLLEIYAELNLTDWLLENTENPVIDLPTDNDITYLDWAKTQDKIALRIYGDIWILTLPPDEFGIGVGNDVGLEQITGLSGGFDDTTGGHSWSSDDSQLVFEVRGRQDNLYVVDVLTQEVTRIERRALRADWRRN